MNPNQWKEYGIVSFLTTLKEGGVTLSTDCSFSLEDTLQSSICSPYTNLSGNQSQNQQFHHTHLQAPSSYLRISSIVILYKHLCPSLWWRNNITYRWATAGGYQAGDKQLLHREITGVKHETRKSRAKQREEIHPKRAFFRNMNMKPIQF